MYSVRAHGQEPAPVSFERVYEDQLQAWWHYMPRCNGRFYPFLFTCCNPNDALEREQPEPIRGPDIDHWR